jgi:hypothetical protein
MGFDVSEVGAFLGGATQGVNQGMDLYAKYDELRTKNEARQKQRSMEQKIQELAPMFKTDPVGATKLAGEHAASIGDFDTYQKFVTTAEATQKADALKSGMNAFTGSAVSYQEGATHLNDWARKSGMPTQFQPISNPDGSVTMLGMGTDPKVGKRYTSLQDFHHDTMTLLAPTMLGPGEAMKFEGEQALKESQIGLAGAQTEGAKATTAGKLIENQYAPAMSEAKIGSELAQGAASRASANLAGTQAGDIAATRPGRLALQNENLAQEQLATAVKSQTVGADIIKAETAAQAAQREEQTAQLTQGDKIAVVKADTVKARADAAKAESEAANAGLNADVERRAKEAQIDWTKSGKGAQTNASIFNAIKPYVNELPGVHEPYEDGGAMAGLTAAIMEETGGKDWQAAQVANDVLKNYKAVTEYNPGTGEVVIQGRRVKVGAQAVHRLKQLRDEARATAAAAGVG